MSLDVSRSGRPRDAVTILILILILLLNLWWRRWDEQNALLVESHERVIAELTEEYEVRAG
jgi:hypothetical protein